jgi:hypothetical protein
VILLRGFDALAIFFCFGLNFFTSFYRTNIRRLI